MSSVCTVAIAFGILFLRTKDGKKASSMGTPPFWISLVIMVKGV